MTRKTIKTVCSLCGLCGCGLEVDVEDGRIVEVRGDPDHPESRGGLCPKAHALLDIQYSPDRLTHPIKRVGKRGEGKWQRISWDEALDLVADRLKQVRADHGAEAVWFHKGAGHDNCAGDVRAYLHRLANAFGTPNLSCPFYVCYGPRVLNMFMMTGAIPAPEVERSRCVLLWGINPRQSAPPRHRRIREAQKRGAKTIVVDPRQTWWARHADIHLQLRPGSDGALALGMLRVVIDEGLIDRAFVDRWTVGFDDLVEMLQDFPVERVAELTWVPADRIREAARLYAQHGPACAFLGQALDPQPNSSQAIRAITALIAVTGNLDVPGGNVIYSPGRLAKSPTERHDWLAPEQDAKRLGNHYLLSRFEHTRLAHMPTGYQAILEGDPYPVRAMFVMAANPVLTDANSAQVVAALEALDFLVVVDQFMTPTAALADVVLPAATFLEETYYATYEAGAYLKPVRPGLLMLRPQVVPPLGECRSDWTIIVDLARRLGLGKQFPWQRVEEAIDEELKPTGVTVTALRAQPEGVPIPAPSFLYDKLGDTGLWGRLMIWLLTRTVFRKYPWMYRKYRRIGFTTPSGKVELRSDRFAQAGLDALPRYREPDDGAATDGAPEADYPLVLTTGAKVSAYVHSQMHDIAKLGKTLPANEAELHPKSAAAVAVADGDEVCVETPQGELTCRARVTERVRPGVVQLYHGFAEANANLLIGNELRDPVTGAVPMRAARCRLHRAA